MSAEPRAALGPRPAGAWEVPLSDVRLPPEAVVAATEVLESGWLTSGPRVRAFELAVAEYVGTRHAVACSSGSAALQLSFSALGVGPGDEVVMPSLSFVAHANAAHHLGARIVFADVGGGADPAVAPAAVEAALTPRTRAVVVMHYAGQPCRPEAIEAARARSVAVVEDAAHALGASVAGRGCGALGSLGCFSFYSNKNLPLGEGGMVVTDDDELAERVRALRTNGIGISGWERHSGAPPGYDVVTPGFNLKLDEVRAAIGAVLLEGLDAAIARRGRALATYAELLASVPEATPVFAGVAPGTSANHLAVVVLDEGIDRDAVARSMAEHGVQTGFHYPPIHRLTAYAAIDSDVPETDSLAPRLLTLPLFAHISTWDLERVVDALRVGLRAGRR